MTMLKCRGDGSELQFLGRSSQSSRDTVCGEVTPYIEFHLCGGCRKVYVFDNWGSEVDPNKIQSQLKVYGGRLSPEEIKTCIEKSGYSVASAIARE